MYKILASLFEGRYGVERELIVAVYLNGRARDDELAESFVGFDEVFGDGVRDCNKVGLEVLGIADDKRRVDDCGERFVGEISTIDWSTLTQVERKVDIRLLPLENSKRGLDLIVLVVLVLNIVVYTRDFLIAAGISVPYATHE